MSGKNEKYILRGREKSAKTITCLECTTIEQQKLREIANQIKTYP